MIQVKRVYERPSEPDGLRILVDRLWPRGVSKKEAHIDRWARELAPSDKLRVWFGHDPSRFPEFRERYRTELRGHREELTALALESLHDPVTLVFAAKDIQHCNATVLKEHLEEILRSRLSRAEPRKLR